MEGIASYLARHDFKRLFIEELGWDISSGEINVSVKDHLFNISVLAQKRGFQIFRCDSNKYVLFNRRLLKQIQNQVHKFAHEHILIFTCSQPRDKQVWQWSVCQPNGRTRLYRQHPFFSSTPSPKLVSRLSQLRFTLEDEEHVSLVDALARVRGVLDADPELNLFVNNPEFAEKSDQLAVAMKGGDLEAFSDFVMMNSRFLPWAAKRWRRYFYNLDEDDCTQIVAIGLLEAAHRFEPNQGYQFSTYAYHWLRQACQRFGPECANFIRLPQHVLNQCCKLQAKFYKLTERGDFDAVSTHLADLQIRAPKLAEFWHRYEMALNVQRFSDLSGRAFRRYLNWTADEPLSLDDRIDLNFIAENALKTITPEDRMMIRQRYGFDGHAHTLEEIAQSFGLTRERIRQRLERAERQMKPIIAKTLGIALEQVTSPDTEKVQSPTRHAKNAKTKLIKDRVLSVIQKHAKGISLQKIARLDIPPSVRNSVLRGLISDHKISQTGNGRKAVFKVIPRPTDCKSLFEQ